MATVLFGALGTLIGGGGGTFFGTLLGAVGAAAGAYVDQSFVYPAIFGKPKLMGGPKLTDLHLQTAHEGAPMNVCIGFETRVAGTIIWISDIIKEVTEEDVGGKGGGATVTHTNYFVHIAIGLCEGPISGVTKAWANGTRIAGQKDPLSITANDITILKYGPEQFMQSPTAALDQFHAGTFLTVSGAAAPQDNGTFVVLYSYVLSNGNKVVAVENLNCVGGIAGPSITLSAPQLGINNSAYTEDIRVYLGTDTQDADHLIEAAEGVGNVPAYRGLAYIVLEKFALKKFGNSIPQFSFRIAETPNNNLTYGEGAAKILARAGRPASDYDVSSFAGLLRGFAWAGPQSTARLLENLLIAGDGVVRESNQKLVFKPQVSVDVVSVAAETDLAAHEADSELPPGLLIQDRFSGDFPDIVNVSYVDRGRDYQQGSQSARKNEFTVRNVYDMDIPVTMTATEAKTAAHRLLWRANTRRSYGKATLPPSYLNVEETDLLIVPYKGQEYKILVDTVERGNNFLLSVEGSISTVDEILADVAGEEDEQTPDVPYIPPVLIFVVLDFAPLRDADVSNAVLYLAAAAYDYTAEWQGATGYASPDDITYAAIADFSIENVLGTTLTSLPSEKPDRWDRKNTLDVRVSHGSLSNATELDVLNGANRLVVGRELIAFQFAELIDTNTYRLSKLIRGLRDTGNLTGTHTSPGEKVLLLSAVVSGAGYNYSQSGQTRHVKAVAFGGDIDAATAQTLVLNAQSMRPFAPCSFRGRRNLDWNGDLLPDKDDLALKWKRRTRTLAKAFGAAPTPLEDGIERYEIDVLDTFNVVVRVIVIDTLNEAVYTKAEQIEDFGSPQTSVKMRLYQMSPTVGRGKFVEETF